MRANLLKRILFFGFLLMPAVVFAASWSTNGLNLPTANTVEKAEFFLTHRFYGNVDDNPIQNALGMDGGANVSLGFGLRLNDRSDLLVVRNSLYKEYLLTSKLKLSDNLTIMLGAASKTDPTVTQNQNDLIGQLIFSKDLGDHLTFALSPTIANFNNTKPTVALGTTLSYSQDLAISYLRGIEVLGEFIPVLHGYALQYPTLALGVKIKTFGHFFTLMLTNTFQNLPNNYIIGSADNRFHFGFNIIRKFDI